MEKLPAQMKTEMRHLGASLSVIFYMTVCYCAPEMFGGQRDLECAMHLDYANALFVWLAAGCTSVLSSSFMVSYAIKILQERPANEVLNHIDSVSPIFKYSKLGAITFGFAIFSLLSQLKLWPKFDTEHCLMGYNALDFLNWIVLLFMASLPLIMTTIAVCAAVLLYLPRMLQGFFDGIEAQRERDEI